MIFLVNLLSWEYENFITNVIYGALSLLILFISVGINVFFYQKDKKNKLKEIKKIELYNLSNDLNNKLIEHFYELRKKINDEKFNYKEIFQIVSFYLKDIKFLLGNIYNFKSFKCNNCKKLINFNFKNPFFEFEEDFLLINIGRKRNENKIMDKEDKENIISIFSSVINYHSAFKFFSKIENELIIIYRKLCTQCLNEHYNQNIIL